MLPFIKGDRGTETALGLGSQLSIPCASQIEQTWGQDRNGASPSLPYSHPPASS